MSTPPRWLFLTAIGIVVLALHAALLWFWMPAWFDPEGAPAHRAPRVRSVTLASVPPLLPQRPVIAAAPVAVAAAPHVPAARRAEAAPSAPPMDVRPSTVAAPAPASGDVDPETPAGAAAEVIDVPVYATLVPPAGRWHYRLQRGLAVGEAELQWQLLTDARYDLHLEGRVAGVAVLDWASQGRIDPAGIAPDRFAVRRRGRDRQAANFQRDAAKITFSGPGVELPLLAGAQDRLSWLLQLPAIVAAAPDQFTRKGVQVVIFVAGARGGADVWTFVVQGLEDLEGVPTLKLLREPRRLYDTRVEVWLDPAAHYLPHRIVQSPSGGGAALELRREAAPEGR